MPGLGRVEDARAAIEIESERFAGNTVERHFIEHLRAFVGGTREHGVRELDELLATGFPDGEGIYHAVRSYARLGETEKSIESFARAIERGFFCYPAFARESWLDPLRGNSRFVELLRQAQARHRAAARLFEEQGGPRLLGLRGS